MMMVGVVRLDGDRRRRAVGTDLSASRGTKDQRALQEPGQVEHRGVEGGKGGRMGNETHGRKLLVSNWRSAASLVLLSPPREPPFDSLLLVPQKSGLMRVKS
jgi:hypothetical protein